MRSYASTIDVSDPGAAAAAQSYTFIAEHFCWLYLLAGVAVLLLLL
jgi:hypothetical protein